MAAREYVSHLVREDEVVGEPCIGPRKRCANTFRTPATRVVKAGRGGNGGARHEREHDVANLKKRGEDARDGEIREQVLPCRVATAARRSSRKGCRAGL